MSSCAPFQFLNPDRPPLAPPPEVGELLFLGDPGKVPSFNANRFNVVFVTHNFDRSSEKLTTERARELAIAIKGGNGGLGRGVLDHEPFKNKSQNFQFWLWVPAQDSMLVRSGSELCSASGAIDARDAYVEGALKAMGMGHILFMNLLNTDCRPQGTWFDIAELEDAPKKIKAVFQDVNVRQAAWDHLIRNFNPDTLREPEFLLEEVLEALDLEEIWRELFKPFESPRTYLPIASDVISGKRPLSVDEINAFGGHEFGHTFKLWDLYQEDLYSKTDDAQSLAKILKELNQDYDLWNLAGIKGDMEKLAQTVGVALPPLHVNLFHLLIRRPEFEKSIGSPLGYPHCAYTPDEGARWAMQLGVGAENLFQNKGCLYFGANAAMGPNLFFRSSDSIMAQPSLPTSEFDAVETAWILRQIECALRPDANCKKLPWGK